MQGTAIITRGGLVLRKIRGLHRGRYELIVKPRCRRILVRRSFVIR